jgi:hypothetical protein
MAPFLQLALWNTNRLHQHAEELKIFLSLRNIGNKLTSETHFTDKSYLRLPNYTDYHSSHSAGTARDGSAIIIIKSSIKHHKLNNHSEDFLQATTVSVEDYTGLLSVSAVYLPTT